MTSASPRFRVARDIVFSAQPDTVRIVYQCTRTPCCILPHGLATRSLSGAYSSGVRHKAVMTEYLNPLKLNYPNSVQNLEDAAVELERERAPAAVAAHLGLGALGVWPGRHSSPHHGIPLNSGIEV